jgi:hypothetical protein
MQINMKNIITFILFIVFLTLLSNKIMLADNNPLIKFNNIVYDFGDVEKGIELSHSFRFENKGKGMLVISNIKTSCGCTGVIMKDKKEFSEGEDGEIKIVFNTQGRQGLQIKTVTIYTNDPSNSNIILTIKCNILNNN